MSTLPQLNQEQFNYAETALWKAILKQALARLRVSIPAVVQSVDWTKNPPVVTVVVAINELVKTPTGPESIRSRRSRTFRSFFRLPGDFH